MTLTDLRALLERAHGPAADRLRRDPSTGEVLTLTTHDIAAHYLPKDLRVVDPPSGRDVQMSLHTALRWDKAATWLVDLSDPGTVHAIKVALALALGLDPGVMGCAVSWRYGAWGWVLRGTDSSYIMSATIDEQGPIKALVLACQHVLKASS